MPLSIKDPKSGRLARKLVRQIGKSIVAIGRAFEKRLRRITPNALPKISFGLFPQPGSLRLRWSLRRGTARLGAPDSICGSAGPMEVQTVLPNMAIRHATHDGVCSAWLNLMAALPRIGSSAEAPDVQGDGFENRFPSAYHRRGGVNEMT